ncbi:MAG: alkene reductase [Crocinitomicaceae bacterium]|nr:alkene reductase [Crocinitomicaceae bacterium]
MKLFDPFNLKGLELSSRIAMAPLTRRRANRAHDPVDCMATYYAQRANCGLIIAEGTSPSPNGVGYSNMPGLYTSHHVKLWKNITDSVHKSGGKIVLQIMHTGRIGHSNNLPDGARIIGPSAIAKKGDTTTYDLGKQPFTMPNEMGTDEVQTTIREFADCAKLAIQAGFDGIEIHSAHGYLPNQFLNQSSNKRKDQYGGNRENRIRFLLEVIQASIQAIGSEKVALRISPFSYADIDEDEGELIALYKMLAEELNQFNLSYLHLSHMGDAKPVKFELWKKLRSIYSGNLMLCGDFTKDTAELALQNGDADLIAFGRDFISNPDLVERLKNNWPLAERDRTHWYTQGPQGLTDYPVYNSMLHK